MNFTSCWYLFCVLLFLYYLCEIVKIKNKVTYYHRLENATESDYPIFTFCSDLFLASTRCPLMKRKREFSCRPSLPLGCISKDFHRMKVNEIATKLRSCEYSPSKSKNRVGIVRDYLFNGHYCAHMQEGKPKKTLENYLEFTQSINKFEAKLFVNTQDRTKKGGYRVPFDFSKYLMMRNCHIDWNRNKHDPSICNGFVLHLQKFKIIRLPPPYETDCTHYQGSREDCLFDCYRSELRKSSNDYRLFYDLTEAIYLNVSEPTDQLYEESRRQNLSVCNELCSKKDCVEHFYSIEKGELNGNAVIKLLLNNDVKVIEAKPSVTNESIMIYVLGLFGNLFNIAIITSIQNLFKNLKSKIKQFLSGRMDEEKATSRQNFIEHFIFVLTTVFGIVIFIHQSAYILQDYFKYEIIKLEFLTLPKFDKLSVTACFPMKTLERNSKKDLVNSQLMNDDLLANVSLTDLYLNYSLYELDEITKNRSQIVISEFLRKGDFQAELESKEQKSALFFENQKCFAFEVGHQETRLDQLLRFTIYNLHLNIQYSTFYITPDGRKPDSQDPVMMPRFTDFHFESERNLPAPYSSACRSHRFIDPAIYMDCASRQECFEQCVQSEYIRNQSVVISNYFLDLDLYPDEVRKRLQVRQIKQEEVDEGVVSKCLNRFSKEDCEIDRCVGKIGKRHTNKYLISLPLYMLKNTIRLEKKYRWLDLFYYLTNLLSIWLNLPLLAIIKFPVKQLIRKPLFGARLEWKRIRLYFNIVFYIVFLIKVNSIRLEIMRNDYKVIARSDLVNVLHVPKISICFFSESIADGLTGLRLNQLTSEITQIIESIEYLDEHLRLTRITQFNQSNALIHRSFRHYSIYFQQMKCIELVFRFTYPWKYPPSFFTRNFCRITLRTDHHEMFSCLLSTLGEFNFNQRFTLNSQRNMIVYFKKISIRVVDRFHYLRNPLQLFQLFKDQSLNDDQMYFEVLRKRFAEEHNSSTTMIPLTEEYFQFTINNRLFMSFYKQFYERERISAEERIMSKKTQTFNLQKYLSFSNTTVLLLKPSRIDTFLLYENDFTYSELAFYLLSEIAIWLNMSFIRFPAFLQNLKTWTAFLQKLKTWTAFILNRIFAQRQIK